MLSKNSGRRRGASGDYNNEGNSTFEKIEKAILLAAQLKSKESSRERPLRDSSYDYHLETPNFIHSIEDTDKNSRSTLINELKPELASKLIANYSRREGKSSYIIPKEKTIQNSQNYDLLDCNLEFGFSSRNRPSNKSDKSKRKQRAKSTKKMTIDLNKSVHASSINRDSWGDKSRMNPLVIPLNSESNIMSQNSSSLNHNMRRNRTQRNGLPPLGSGDSRKRSNKQNKKLSIISPVKESKKEQEGQSPEIKAIRIATTPSEMDRDSVKISNNDSKIHSSLDQHLRSKSAHLNAPGQRDAASVASASLLQKPANRESKFDSYFNRKKQREANTSRNASFNQTSNMSILKYQPYGNQDSLIGDQSIPLLYARPNTETNWRKVDEERKSKRVEEKSQIIKNHAFISEKVLELEEHAESRSGDQDGLHQPRGSKKSSPRHNEEASLILIEHERASELADKVKQGADKSSDYSIRNFGVRDMMVKGTGTVPITNRVDTLISPSFERLLKLRQNYQSRQSDESSVRQRPLKLKELREQRVRSSAAYRINQLGSLLANNCQGRSSAALKASSISSNRSSSHKQSTIRPLGRAMNIKKLKDKIKEEEASQEKHKKERKKKQKLPGESSEISDEEQKEQSHNTLSQLSCIKDSSDQENDAKEIEIEDVDGSELVNAKTKNRGSKRGCEPTSQNDDGLSSPRDQAISSPRENKTIFRRSRTKRAMNKTSMSKNKVEKDDSLRDSDPQALQSYHRNYFTIQQSLKSGPSQTDIGPNEVTRLRREEVEKRHIAHDTLTKGLNALRQRRFQDIKQEFKNDLQGSEQFMLEWTARHSLKVKQLSLEMISDELSPDGLPSISPREKTELPSEQYFQEQDDAFDTPQQQLSAQKTVRSTTKVQTSIEQSSKYQTVKNFFSNKSLQSSDSGKKDLNTSRAKFQNQDLDLTPQGIQESEPAKSQRAKHTKSDQRNSKKGQEAKKSTPKLNKSPSPKKNIASPKINKFNDSIEIKPLFKSSLINDSPENQNNTPKQSQFALGNKSALSTVHRSQPDFSVKMRESLNKFEPVKERSSLEIVNDRLKRNMLHNNSKTYDEITSIKEVFEPDFDDCQLRTARSGKNITDQQLYQNNTNISNDEVDLYEQYLQTFETEEGLRNADQRIFEESQAQQNKHKASKNKEQEKKANEQPKTLYERLYQNLSNAQKEKRPHAQPSSSLNLDFSSARNHARKESTLVRILTTSVIGEPKMLHVWSAIQNKKTQKNDHRSPWERDQVQSHQVIYLLILKFLEGYDPVGPSIHIFKMAFLNKKMMKLILNVYRIENFHAVAAFEARQKMIKVLGSVPSFEMYGSYHKSIKNTKAVWQNQYYGGTVLKPFKTPKAGAGSVKDSRFDGKKLEKSNPLKKLVTTASVDSDAGGGFYSLRNIKTSANTFLDIEILIEGDIDNEEDVNLLRKLQANSRKDRKNLFQDKSSSNHTSFKAFSSIKPQNNKQKQRPTLNSQSPEKKTAANSKQTTSSPVNDDLGKGKKSKMFVPLAQNQDMWSQGLRFTSPRDAIMTIPSKPKPAAKSPAKKPYVPMPRYASSVSPTKPRNFTHKSEIKHMLTGVARIIEFGTTFRHEQSGRKTANNMNNTPQPREIALKYDPTIDQKQNFIISVSEGQFVKGLFHGFSRCINAEGECYIGNWKRVSENASKPCGKFTGYNKDGTVKQIDGVSSSGELNANYLIKQRNMEKI